MRVTDEMLTFALHETQPGSEIRATPRELREVPVRRYEPDAATIFDTEERPWATLVWVHGGSFVRGSLDWPESDWAARRFADSGLRVVAVDYRLANETVKAPTPANDVALVLEHELTKNEGRPVLIGGASAGAHLAVEAALSCIESELESRPAAVLMLYPTAHRRQRPNPQIAALTSELPEQRQFSPERIAHMYEFYLGGREPAAFPRRDGVRALELTVIGEAPVARLAQLPPTVLVHAERDDLRASGEQFAEQLHAAGVRATQQVIAGTLHGFVNRPNETPQAEQDARAAIDALAHAAKMAC